MCGITGWVAAPGASVGSAELRTMNQRLVHRGPDDEGYFIDRSGGAGLGHRRLSIIDLEGGHQPIGSEDGQIQAVVNGEIYNFKTLRSELEAEGYRFKTRSDSEVVVHGYLAWGEGLFKRLDGMFALAIWDRRARKLFLARDPMGKKPLYYAELPGGGLIFASELKALLAHPEFPRTLSKAGIWAYLAYESLPEDLAIYEAARKLDSGHYLIFEAGKRPVRVAFWQMRFGASPDAPRLARLSEAALVEELQERILAATEKRLVSDVPLGVLLSGGVDSSVVAAAMAKLGGPGSVQSFSVSFKDPSFDESSHARRVSEHVGSVHHEIQLSPERLLDILPEVADILCEPLGDGSIIPTYLLSEFTRQHVTVALGGDGGDELFLGYPTFQAARVSGQLRRFLGGRLTGLLGRGFGRAAAFLPVSTENMSKDFIIKRFLSGLSYEAGHQHQAWMGSFLPESMPAVLAERFRSPPESPYQLIDQVRADSDARDELDQLVLQYSRFFLQGCVLVKVDRASMAHSLEVRAPLLDQEVVAFAAAMPGTMRLHQNTTKYLLKQAARAWLPAEIVDRPKKGFGMPIGTWLKGPLRELGETLLGRERLAEQGLLNPSEVRRLWLAHQAGQADHRKPLWTLMVLQLWWDRFGPEAPRAPLLDPLAPDDPRMVTVA